jgi:hypothetical protein
MPEKIQLEIDAADAPEYIEIIQRKRLSVDEEIERKQAELNELISKSTSLGFMLERLQGKYVISTPIRVEVVGKSPTQIINGYDPKWSIWDKIQYVLRKEIEPLSKGEIIERIDTFDHKIAHLDGKKRRQFSVSVSSCLSTKSSKGLLGRRVIEGEDSKYYLSSTENE